MVSFIFCFLLQSLGGCPMFFNPLQQKLFYPCDALSVKMNLGLATMAALINFGMRLFICTRQWSLGQSQVHHLKSLTFRGILGAAQLIFIFVVILIVGPKLALASDRLKWSLLLSPIFSLLYPLFVIISSQRKRRFVKRLVLTSVKWFKDLFYFLLRSNRIQSI